MKHALGEWEIHTKFYSEKVLWLAHMQNPREDEKIK